MWFLKIQHENNFELTATKLKDPTHFKELVIGQRAGAGDHASPDDDGHQACDEEEAPEGSINWENEPSWNIMELNQIVYSRK